MQGSVREENGISVMKRRIQAICIHSLSTRLQFAVHKIVVYIP